MTISPERTFTTLGQRGLRHHILPMRLYHKAKKLGIWDPRNIDLTRDQRDWQHIPENYKESLLRLLCNFQAGEEAVTLDLLPLVLTMSREGRLEEELFLTTFLWEEAKHTEFFRRILDEVLQEQDDLHTKISIVGGQEIFARDLPEAMNLLLTDPSPANQASASVVYNMIVEGVLAETGYYGFGRLLSQVGMMPGLQEGIQLIKRDEARHIAYGVFLISRLVAQEQSLWPLVEHRMQDLFARIEQDQIKGNLHEDLRAYARQQFEKRLARIAKAREQTLEQLYNEPELEAEEG